MTFARMSPAERLASALAGPAANALTAFVLIPFIVFTSGTARGLAIVFFLASTIAALWNLVPQRVRGRKSDGLVVLEQLRALRQPVKRAVDGSSVQDFVAEFDRTWARWFALFSNPSATCRTRARGEMLSRLAAEIDPSVQVEPLFPLVYAGWCWREVERGSLREPADVARKAYAMSVDAGLSQPDSLVKTAIALARFDMVADGVAAGFLARAIHHLPTSLSAAVEESTRAQAFLAGVALHDVELVAPLL